MEQWADGDAPPVQGLLEADKRAAEHRSRQQQQVERARPMQRESLGWVDPREHGVEPRAGLPQLLDPAQSQVRVRASEHTRVDRADVADHQKDVAGHDQHDDGHRRRHEGAFHGPCGGARRRPCQAVGVRAGRG